MTIQKIKPATNECNGFKKFYQNYYFVAESGVKGTAFC